MLLDQLRYLSLDYVPGLLAAVCGCHADMNTAGGGTFGLQPFTEDLHKAGAGLAVQDVPAPALRPAPRTAACQNDCCPPQPSEMHTDCSLRIVVVGKGLTEQELDSQCEAYLHQRFGQGLDFAIAGSIAAALADGIVERDEQVAHAFTDC